MTTIQNFPISKGKITISSDEMTITDNASMHRIILIIMSIFLLANGSLNVIRYQRNDTGDLMLYSGIFIIVLSLIIMLLSVKRSTQSSIVISEIKKVRFKKNWSDHFNLTIFTNHGKQRIIDLGKSEEQIEHLSDYFHAIATPIENKLI